MTAAADFTLLVPTYNRPEDLGRLLRFLAHPGSAFRVVVLDSSAPPAQERNRSAVAAAGERFTFRSFDSSVSPWQKFWQGGEQVTTRFCGMCADDDLVLPEAVDRLVSFLEEEPIFAMAHGWYFAFDAAGPFGITAAVYRGASIEDADPLRRLHVLLRRYEPLTYGVYRTEVMQAALRGVQKVRSLMASELLGGAIAVALGKAARLPLFYYGRSLEPSQTYVHHHPLDFLVSSPDGLFQDYAAYRATLLQALGGDDTGRTSAIIDYIHLRYFSEYARPEVMDHIVEQSLAGTDKERVMQGVWSILSRDDATVIGGLLRGTPLIRRIRDRWFPKVRLHHVRRFSSRSAHRAVSSTTAAGRRREYLLHADFLEAVRQDRGLEGSVPALLRALDRFE